MTSSEDFKQAIRAGNIEEAFLVAMSNAPELNITTKIITAEGNQHQVDSNQSQGDNSLRTHISLIEGKVENEIGEKLTGDRYSEIKQFHIEQVTQGHQTIQHNLISLQKMFQLMSTFQQQTSEDFDWVDIAADVAREPLPARRETNQLSANKTPEAIAPGETTKKTEVVSSNSNIEIKTNNPEPHLPSFVPGEEDDALVDDLLSLADLDDNNDSDWSEENPQPGQGDWGDWLEEEADDEKVKSEVFDLKSLNIREAAQNWQNWEGEANSTDSKKEQH